MAAARCCAWACSGSAARRPTRIWRRCRPSCCLPGQGGQYGIWYVSSLILTGVIGSLCWPTSYQRIYTASGVGAVKKGTVQTMIVAGGFYALLTLVALAASGLDVVSAKPQDGWFTLLYHVGGEWMLGLAIVIVLAASMGWVDGCVQVCGAQIANDIVQVVSPRTDRQMTIIAKASMAVFMLGASVVAFLTYDFHGCNCWRRCPTKASCAGGAAVPGHVLARRQPHRRLAVDGLRLHAGGGADLVLSRRHAGVGQPDLGRAGAGRQPVAVPGLPCLLRPIGAGARAGPASVRRGRAKADAPAGLPTARPVGPERTGRVRVARVWAGRVERTQGDGRGGRPRLGRRPSLRAKVGAFPDLPRSRSTMPDFFGNLIDQILGFARAHEQWLPAIGFAFAFVKSLPLVALFVPGTALLLSIGAVLGSGAGQFAPVWLAIAIGAALGDWVAYALGVKVGPALLQWAPLRRRPRQVLRAAAFIKRWGVLSIVLCRFFGPLRATVPTLAGIFEMRRGPFQAANWASAFLWAAACWRRAGRAWAGSWAASARAGEWAGQRPARHSTRVGVAQPGHGVGVDMAAVAHRVVAQFAFDREAVLAVQGDGGFVVGIDHQFHPAQVHPVVGHVQQRAKQAAADALAVPALRDRDADAAAMAAPDAFELLQAGVSRHLALHRGDQADAPFAVLFHALAPSFQRRVGQLQDLARDVRIAMQRGDARTCCSQARSIRTEAGPWRCCGN